MLTCPVEDLRTTLSAQPALIVHFSGVPKGTGHSTGYPMDLRFALSNPGEILSCSTIEPNDFDGSPAATGSIGVILDPVDENSIIMVCHEDIGAPRTTAERKLLDRPTSLVDCKRSFIRDGCTFYNEWLVGTYRPLAIFVAPYAQVQNPDTSYRDVSFADVWADLGEVRIISCLQGAFVEVFKNAAEFYA